MEEVVTITLQKAKQQNWLLKVVFLALCYIKTHKNEKTPKKHKPNQTTKYEVRSAIKRQKNCKPLVYDCIDSEVLKLLEDRQLDILTRLFNSIYETGELPKDWYLSLSSYQYQIRQILKIVKNTELIVSYLMR